MPKRIENLTKEQESQMAQYAQRWIDECLRPGTTEEDWVRAEAGIKESYIAAGLDPVPIIRTTSPLACVIAGPIAASIIENRTGNKDDAVDSAVDSAVGGAVDDAVDSAVDSAVHGAVDSAVHGAVYSAVGNAVDSAVHGAVYSAVGNAVDSAVGGAVDDAVHVAVDSAVGNAVHGAVDSAVDDAVHGAVHGAVRSAVDSAVYDAVDSAVDGTSKLIQNNWTKYNGGSLWPRWVSWRLFFIDVCGLELDEKTMKLAETWRKLSTGTGWWWPHKEFCIVAPRHEEIHRDPEGRLHCENGPALKYPDGWSIYSWHGVRVPSEWIEKKEELNPEIALNWENVEQRRCAAEIIGWDKVLEKIPHKIIDEDYDPMVGTLIQADLPDADGQQFLKVLCGTGRHFVLPCVNNEFKTALDANAASWGEDGIDPQMIRNREWRT